MPAWFGDNPADLAWYPPDTEEKEKAFGAWLEGAAPPKHLPKVQPVMKSAKEQFPSIESWAMMGCKSH